MTPLRFPTTDDFMLEGRLAGLHRQQRFGRWKRRAEPYILGAVFTLVIALMWYWIPRLKFP
jgi:hypothetical protein